MNHKALLALGLALFSTAVFAQTTSASASASATTSIYVPITITKTADLNFGDVFPGSTSGTVTVDAAGGATTFTGTGVSLGVHAASRAVYSIGGKKSSAFVVALPADGTITMTGPGPAIPVNTFSASVGGGAAVNATSIPATMAASGAQTLAVGATMTLASAATQTEGSYSGTYLVTVTYN